MRKFAVPLMDPLEEAEVLAYHIAYDGGEYIPEPSVVDALADLEQDVFLWLMSSTVPPVFEIVTRRA